MNNSLFTHKLSKTTLSTLGVTSSILLGLNETTPSVVPNNKCPSFVLYAALLLN